MQLGTEVVTKMYLLDMSHVWVILWRIRKTQNFLKFSYYVLTLGFCMGTGLPAVFRLWVPWLRVWFLISATAGKSYP
jgi:hypothetical protein